jgi:toxin FitB
MHAGTVIELPAEPAVLAANINGELKLPMAGSLILATARVYDAVIWTQDADFHVAERRIPCRQGTAGAG